MQVLSITDTQVQVRRSIRSATRLLADLQHHLNNAAPVHRLPPELLSMIFILATYVHHRHKGIFQFDDQSFNFSLRRQAIGVTTITQICKRWRTVALETPALWTYISSAPKSDQFNAYLERSRTLPISLSLDARVDNLGDTLSLIAPRLSRLDLRITSRPIEDVGPSLFCVDAPFVRCATLMCPRDLFPMKLDEGGRDVTWIELFGGRESLLEGLALALPTNWLPSNTFTQLTHLLLSCNMLLMTTTQSGLLTLLGNTPRLEFLHIIHLWYIDLDVQRTPASLSRLRSLVIDTSVWWSLRLFFARLSFPKGTPITLLNIETSMEPAIPTPVLDHSSPLTSLEIYVRGPQLQILARSESHDFLLQWDDGLWGWHELAPEFDNLFSLSAITSVKLALDCETVDLTPVLINLEHVTHLEMYSWTHGHSHEPEEEVLCDTAFGDLFHELSHLTITFQDPFTVEHPVISGAADIARECAGTGTALRRVVVQLSGLATTPIAPQEVDLVRKEFVHFVDELEVRSLPSPPIRPYRSPFSDGPRFIVDGAESYWTLYDRAKPIFIGPYDWEIGRAHV